MSIKPTPTQTQIRSFFQRTPVDGRMVNAEHFVGDFAGVFRIQERVDPRSLKPSSFNPVSRTTKNALRELHRKVEVIGSVLNPLHVLQDYTVSDGHRRREVAIDLGFADVPVFRYFGPAEKIRELFVILNVSTRAFKPADALCSVLQGGPSPSESMTKKAEYVRGLLSEFELEQFIDAGYSYYLVETALRITSYIMPGESKSSRVFRAFARKTVVWLMDNKQQQNAIAYMRMAFKNTNLRKAIENNQPVTFPATKGGIPRTAPLRTAAIAMA